MSNYQVVSQGECSTMRTCAWKWNLKYNHGLEPADGVYHRALNVGSMVHDGIAAAYREVQRQQLLAPYVGAPIDMSIVNLAAQVEMERALVEFNEEQLDLFEGMPDEGGKTREEEADEVTKEALSAIRLFLDNVLSKDVARFLVVAVELPFKVPLIQSNGRKAQDEIEGVMDLVLFDIETRKLVLGEHKTTRGDAFTYDFRLDVDPQIPLYLHAMMRMFGPELVGGSVHLNVVRKRLPRVPNTNKDGTVSTAECDTTKEVYERALMAQTLEPEWLRKAREHHAEKGTAKSLERLEKNQDKWRALQEKQQRYAASLGGIERFASRHEAVITRDQIFRHTVDAWSATRHIRAYQNGSLVPMRNGYVCNAKAMGKCVYREACTMEVVEPGELLRKRTDRHPEVVRASKEAEEYSQQPALMQAMELVHEHCRG